MTLNLKFIIIKFISDNYCLSVIFRIVNVSSSGQKKLESPLEVEFKISDKQNFSYGSHILPQDLNCKYRIGHIHVHR